MEEEGGEGGEGKRREGKEGRGRGGRGGREGEVGGGESKENITKVGDLEPIAKTHMRLHRAGISEYYRASVTYCTHSLLFAFSPPSPLLPPSLPVLQ